MVALLTSVLVYARFALLIVLRRPYKLSLLAASRCNLRCQICSIWQNRNTTLKLAEVERLWQAFRVKPAWINLSGGEVLLNRELEAILSFFVGLRRPLLITITSNGLIDCSAMLRRVL